jgi:hypothetical protein
VDFNDQFIIVPRNEFLIAFGVGGMLDPSDGFAVNR